MLEQFEMVLEAQQKHGALLYFEDSRQPGHIVVKSKQPMMDDE